MRERRQLFEADNFFLKGEQHGFHWRAWQSQTWNALAWHLAYSDGSLAIIKRKAFANFQHGARCIGYRRWTSYSY